MSSVSLDALTDQIRVRTAEVQARIEAACARSGRSPDTVTLIAVTKTFPVEVVQAAVAAGLRDFGENRVQELVAKSDVLPGEVLAGAIRWHLIGSLQRNKARDAAARADLFHALDSMRLAEALDKRAAQEERVLPCLVQVNVSGEDTKSGVEPDAVHAFVDDLAAFAHLRVLGLMTLAAPAASPEEVDTLVRPQFRHLRRLAESYGGANPHATTTMLSMGMSGDYEVAIEEGATHVRLGTALFGARG
ncbi:MAG: YggS family pyridoxal phosphate-dependent enzyme [Rhodothermaceae bacterium]|nr:YggS family pyridoxal phosphate-dependent enzyme [Rhodothermaceae bacterium]